MASFCEMGFMGRRFRERLTQFSSSYFWRRRRKGQSGAALATSGAHYSAHGSEIVGKEQPIAPIIRVQRSRNEEDAFQDLDRRTVDSWTLMKVERRVTKSIPDRQSSPFSFIQQERAAGTWIIDEDAVRWALFSLLLCCDWKVSASCGRRGFAGSNKSIPALSFSPLCSALTSMPTENNMRSPST